MPEEKGKAIPVMVALRCRPLIQREIREGCQPCLHMVSGEPQVVLGKDRPFTYDFAFAATDPQSQVYEVACKKLIQSIFKGYNATILAYGQTGSGKTHTMGGNYEDSLGGDEEGMGVIPRVLRDIFVGIQDNETYDYTVRISYMEIYNEEVNDLLCPVTQRKPLSIHEEGHGGIKVHGLREVDVSCFQDTMKCLTDGAHGRTTGSTAMNSTSSRSHAIFTLIIEQTKKGDLNDCCKVKFHLVDLAGSERCKRTQAEGDRFKEGVNINKGLLALGNVISALGEEGTKRNHIPYRDSKLTRILQDSLGGNSHTLMIACVSPADSNIEETLNTLRYADRARKIKNKPVINRDPQAAEIMRLKTLVQQLQGQLISGGFDSSTVSSICSGSGNAPTPKKSSDEMAKLQARNRELEIENEKLSKELRNSVEESTRMLDQVMRLEMANEAMKAQLAEIKEHGEVDIELLSASIKEDLSPEAQSELDKLKKLRQSLSKEPEIPPHSEIKDEEESNEDEAASDEETHPSETISTPDTRAFQQKHALRQAELHRQLSQITRSLSNKQKLAEAMSTQQTDEEMKAMKIKYEEMAAEWQAKTEQLEKEKKELTATLAGAQANANALKVSEQRRKRLRELEQQMSEYKKKMSEQAKMVKLKDSSDKQVVKLNSEIQLLKQQRVKLMKQMRAETVEFQKWKREKDKEVQKLQQKDRKRDFEIKKMKTDFEKQQTVQKRRTEEAIAANKRLRDALDKHKVVQNERTGKLEKCDSAGIGNRVRKWLSHELDVKVSLRETQYHLAELMNNRKELTQQLQELRDQLEGGPLQQKFSWLGENGDKDDIAVREEEIKKQITSIELDIELINVNIEELQQKIVEADQESKGKSTFQSLHTMVEAKCAAKFLLEQAVNARAENMKTSGDLRDIQVKEQEEVDKVKELKAEISSLKARHDREVNKLKTEYDEKTLFLLNADPKLTNGTKLGGKMTQEKMKLLEAKVHRLEEIERAYHEKEIELENMKQKITSVAYKSKSINLFGDVNDQDCTSPFINPKPKMSQLDDSTGTMNSTFVVDEPPPAKPLDRQPLQAKRNTRAANKKKAEESATNLNATFTSSGNSETEEEPNRSKRGRPKRKTTSKKTSKKSSEKQVEGDENAYEEPAKKREKSSGADEDSNVGKDSANNTVDDSAVDESGVENRLSSNFLKRRSGEEPSDNDADLSRERKKRKRTLLATTNKGFFADL